ncbi:hypothetical protein NKR23_g9834 [Pleurostoma richardsiae]|uniref:Uncharacterized protein n=1 Tax=Pleurostoma richardsiae TaxID=41990 RepID=A0AA38VMI6_9PEZI|nr:hypothetical protein NKR23_g9834 [Pleurostoma richardsiae]
MEGPGSRDVDRDLMPPRRSGRDSSSVNREPLPGGGRDLMSNGRESRHSRGEGRGDGGSGGRPPEEWGPGGRGGGPGRGSGGGMRESGPRPGDDRREQRLPDDRSRKRRSGEDIGPSDREKRPRR